MLYRTAGPPNASRQKAAYLRWVLFPLLEKAMAMVSLMPATTTASLHAANRGPACYPTDSFPLPSTSPRSCGPIVKKFHLSTAVWHSKRGSTGNVHMTSSHDSIGRHERILNLSIDYIGFSQRAISAMSREEESQSLRVSETDLLVVGPGVLGRLVAQLWLKENEESTVVGQTNTTANHEDLKGIGIVPVVKEDPRHTEKFPYVIFCAPPSGSSDYVAEVRSAAQKWNGEGTLLFTSSSALYDVIDNGFCDEESAPSVPKGKGPRTDKLLDAEDEILKVGGNVVRLAGLYLLNRGAHTFYLSKGTVDARPDHMLNFIHYEDAASLCVAILTGDSRGRLYMGCDSSPITRQELMDAVNASGKYEQKFQKFTGVDGPLGKRMDNSSTRMATGWEPKNESFLDFLGVQLQGKTQSEETSQSGL